MIKSLKSQTIRVLHKYEIHNKHQCFKTWIYPEINNFSLDGNYDGVLREACFIGNTIYIRKSIDKGAKDFNGGFVRACYGGHTEIDKFIIDKGANN